jgi:UDPglucose 6-dehydrogenase
MNIAVIGTGYVGLVTAACFAKLKNRVIAFDNDLRKIRLLKRGKIPIYEPGLEELVKEGLKNNTLKFCESIIEGIKNSEVIFICVGTPPTAKGSADLSAIEYVSREIAMNMNSYKLVVGKSTVPVKTGEWIKRTINLYNKSNIQFDVASNPEFLREGTAIKDFLYPDRIVIGCETERAKNILLKLYEPIKAPKIVTNIETAELIKHAANSFLAMKISFINALSQICEKTNANIKQIAEGIGLDHRIGKEFLNAGPGYGGYCLPKDISAFISICEELGYEFNLLKEVERINEQQREFIIKKIEQTLWVVKNKTIGVLGLSFKPNTDDIRFSPSIKIIKELINLGARIKAYDPAAMKKAKQELPDIEYKNNPYEVAKNSDALLIITDWDEFKRINLKRIKELLKTPIIIDCRNLFEPDKMKKLGFIYKGVGI